VPHKTLLTSKSFTDNVLPVINERQPSSRPEINALYSKERTARLKVTDGKRFPALRHDPTLLLDINRYSDWLDHEVATNGSVGSKAWGETALKQHRHLLPTEDSKTISSEWE
jgi:hypothetical protein